VAQYLGAVKVKELGKKIDRTGDKQPYIPSGNRLVMVLFNHLWEIAVDVTGPGEYQSKLRDYVLGLYVTLELYLLTPEQLEQCPDQGWGPV
jgi:hypothetical protein